MNAAFLQLSLLPSQLGCRGGIGGDVRASAVSNKMYSSTAQGRVPLAHVVLELLCLTVLDLNRSPDFE